MLWITRADRLLHLCRQFRTDRPFGAAAQLRKAAFSWAAAVEEGAPPLSGIGESVPASLLTLLDEAADLLYALSTRTALFREVRLQTGETWVHAARRITAEIRDALVDHERRAVDQMAALVPGVGEVARVSPRAADKRTLMSDRWVILVNMDDGGDWDHGAFMTTTPLSDDDALRLAHRVIALPTLDGAIVAGTGVALGHPGLFPLAPDDARAIAAELGRPVLEGGTIDTVDRALGALLEISALLAAIPVIKDPRRAEEWVMYPLLRVRFYRGYFQLRFVPQNTPPLAKDTLPRNGVSRRRPWCRLPTS